MFYHERCRGSYKWQTANEFTTNMLNHAVAQGIDIVVVADNAPAHAIMQQVFVGDFSGATLLKLPPYSPMLNPIENVWSFVKSHLKTSLRERLDAFVGPHPEGLTRQEYRMQLLERYADAGLRAVNTREFIFLVNHLELSYARATAGEDMDVGR